MNHSPFSILQVMLPFSSYVPLNTVDCSLVTSSTAWGWVVS
ncbi:MAG: hypothetical protein ACOYZ8_01550 [Chloroflexota bacterium]